jgi:hypothetical protein
MTLPTYGDPLVGVPVAKSVEGVQRAGRFCNWVGCPAKVHAPGRVNPGTGAYVMAERFNRRAV